jgi:Domain of unknown function (DUF1996)
MAEKEEEGRRRKEGEKRSVKENYSLTATFTGVNLDNPDQSHVAYPIESPNGGNCPSTHPVRLPLLYYQVVFSVDLDLFPHGEGRQPFVLSCGDSTGILIVIYLCSVLFHFHFIK